MNVIKITNKPKPEKKVSDLKPGESGYVVSWAYNEQFNRLDESAPITDTPSDTSRLRVVCVRKGQYEITYPRQD